jgi:hypothetical protein
MCRTTRCLAPSYYSMCPHIQYYDCMCPLSAYVSIRQHTSAYVSIRQHTSAYVSIRQHTSAYVSIRQHKKATGNHNSQPLCTLSLETGRETLAILFFFVRVIFVCVCVVCVCVRIISRLKQAGRHLPCPPLLCVCVCVCVCVIPQVAGRYSILQQKTAFETGSDTCHLPFFFVCHLSGGS